MRVDKVSAGTLIGIGYHIKVSTFKELYCFISIDIFIGVYCNSDKGVSSQNIFCCEIIKIISASIFVKIHNVVPMFVGFGNRWIANSGVCSSIFRGSIISLIFSIPYS